jgi:hypothetical protein
MVHPHVAAVGPAQLLQPFQERRVARLNVRIARSRARDYANVSDAIGLLRAYIERPRRRCATKKCNELASPQLALRQLKTGHPVKSK